MPWAFRMPHRRAAHLVSHAPEHVHEAGVARARTLAGEPEQGLDDTFLRLRFSATPRGAVVGGSPEPSPPAEDGLGRRDRRDLRERGTPDSVGLLGKAEALLLGKPGDRHAEPHEALVPDQMASSVFW
jgi:hypothetical protein